MNPTHETGNNAAQPQAFGESFLADLFTDRDRFRSWVASATGTAAQPTAVEAIDVDSVTYELTEKGRAALSDADCDSSQSTCPVDLITETDDQVTARVLRSAATYLERHGWIQGAYYDATSGSFTPPACQVGAIGMVCYGGPVDAPTEHFNDPGFLNFEAAMLHLDRYLLAEDGSEAYEFNDAKGRRLEDVTHVLRDAASRPEPELIDALRVIDQHNADLVALSKALIPGGTFAEAGKKPTDPVPATCPVCRAVDPELAGVIRDEDELRYCDDDWHFRIYPTEGGAE